MSSNSSDIKTAAPLNFTYTMFKSGLLRDDLELMITNIDADPSIIADIYALIPLSYGPYLCQQAGDHMLHGRFAGTHYSIPEVSNILETYMLSVCNSLAPEDQIITNHTASLIAEFALHRLNRTHNSSAVVASCLLYASVVTCIRHHAWQALKDYKAKGGKYSGMGLDENWVQHSDPTHEMYFRYLDPRVQSALKVLGTEVRFVFSDKVVLLEDKDANLGKCVSVAMDRPRWRAFKLMHYDVQHPPQNTVDWLVKVACTLFSDAVQHINSGIEGGGFNYDIYSDAVQELAPSMLTSTTGATLSCDTAILMPKAMEGARLLENLTRHMTQYSDEFRNDPVITEYMKRVDLWRTITSEKEQADEKARRDAHARKGAQRGRPNVGKGGGGGGRS